MSYGFKEGRAQIFGIRGADCAESWMNVNLSTLFRAWSFPQERTTFSAALTS